MNLNLGLVIGEFKSEKANGKAVCYFSNANSIHNLKNAIKFKGEMINGIMNGAGKMFFPNGTHYDGSFQNNKMIGKSKFFYKDGSYLNCSLDNNSQIISFATFTQKDHTDESQHSKIILKTSFENSINDFPGELMAHDYTMVGFFKDLKPDQSQPIKLIVNSKIYNGIYDEAHDKFIEATRGDECTKPFVKVLGLKPNN